jgi:hypothetical protein
LEAKRLNTTLLFYIGLSVLIGVLYVFG